MAGDLCYIGRLSPELCTHIFLYVLGDDFASSLLSVMLVNREWKVKSLFSIQSHDFHLNSLVDDSGTNILAVSLLARS
jgi:hypothetical protein